MGKQGGGFYWPLLFEGAALLGGGGLRFPGNGPYYFLFRWEVKKAIGSGWVGPTILKGSVRYHTMSRVTK